MAQDVNLPTLSFVALIKKNLDRTHHFCKACKHGWTHGGKLRKTKGVEEEGQNQYLRCPRCQSTNTIFKGYNNNNPDQRRHFCNACKRTWRWRQSGELDNTKGVEEEGPNL